MPAKHPADVPIHRLIYNLVLRPRRDERKITGAELEAARLLFFQCGFLTVDIRPEGLDSVQRPTYQEDAWCGGVDDDI